MRTPKPPGTDVMDRPPRHFATVQVYLDDGTKFEYECPATQAREHLFAIVMTGAR